MTGRQCRAWLLLPLYGFPGVVEANPRRPRPHPHRPHPQGRHDRGDDATPAPPTRARAALEALLPSNSPGCAPGARCIRVNCHAWRRPLEHQEQLHRAVPRRFAGFHRSSKT